MGHGSHEREEIRKQLLPFFEQLLDTVVEARGDDASMRVEQDIARAGDQLGAEAIGQWLLSHDIAARHIAVDGQMHYRMNEAVAKTYHTRRGGVRLVRHVYRPSGEHNGKIVCPLEVSVGMIGGYWTPGCAEAMAYVAQELPEADRDTYEKATIRSVKIPDDTGRMAVSIDRVSHLVDEEDSLRWRMAYCGTLMLYDDQGEPLKTLRYGRMPGEGAHILREQMKWDVAALQERRGDLEVVALSDGAAELCNILDEDYPQAARYIDYYHLVEKLSAALGAFCGQRGTTQDANKVLAKWKTRLLNKPNAIEHIELAIKRWRAEDIEVGGQKPVHQALTYIANHKEQMNYAKARAKGHPIGSGHVEACCSSWCKLE